MLLRAPRGRLFPFLVQNVALLSEEQQHEWGVNVWSRFGLSPCVRDSARIGLYFLGVGRVGISCLCAHINDIP